MDFKEYWLDLDKAAREAFADRCDTTVGHLNNIAYGTRSANAELSVAIDRESGGVVPCESTTPQLRWAWSYLRGTQATPSSRSVGRKRA